MCISNGPADFTRTKLYAGCAGEEHVLIYKNTVRSRASEPNAMLLHFPAVPGTMSQDSVLPTDTCGGIVDEMIVALMPQTRGGGHPAAVVFDTGVYTVVLAEDPRAIPPALGRVPERKRPPINEPLFDWYAETFSDWPVALCCFDNADAVEAAPMMWRYRPRNPRLLFYPALDSHTGGIPELDGTVGVEHWLLTQGEASRPVRYGGVIADLTRRYLPERVAGRHVREDLPNGDFVFDGDRGFQRVAPEELVSLIG